MLLRFFRWLFGYVEFSFTGGFAEKFINDCRSNNIYIKNIIKRDNVLFARVTPHKYFRLHRLAFACGGRVRVTKRRGLPFLLMPLKNRWGLFCGALFAVMLISFLSGFVWNITVIGESRLTDAQVVNYLAQNGFRVGTRWANADKENLEFKVLSDFDEVAWISINKLGCLAQIEISETEDKPPIVSTDITNVKAKKDGVIVHITSLGGWQVAEDGEAVSKGDLLISGIYESEVDEQNHYAHAHGTVLAKTEHQIKINVSRRQLEKDYTYKNDYKSLYFFGLNLPLYAFRDKGDSEIIEENTCLVLNGFRLPLGVVKQHCRYYVAKENLLTDDELETLAKSELERKKAQELADCEILNEAISIETGEDSCLITADYALLEDIAQEYVIAFENEN